MKISVIVPSYNQGHFIARTVESVLDQRDPDVQLIIMDGGSKDNTLQVLEPYRKHIDVLVSERDKGQSDALQKGLKYATGDYIGWQNSDDVYLPGFFRKVREAIAADAQRGQEPADVYFGDQMVMDAEDNLIYRKTFGPFRLPYLLYMKWNITNQTSLFAKKALDRVGGFDPSLQYAMDFDLYVRLGLAGARFHWLGCFTGGFRLHGDSKGSTMQGTRAKEYDLLRKKYLPGYRSDIPWEKQFTGPRRKEILLRGLWLLYTGRIRYMRKIKAKLPAGPEAGVA